MRLHAYLLSAQQILQQYTGDIPFAAWLKVFFREHKKYGSRDRRLIADLCFCFFRLGKAFADRDTEERLLIGQFLCREESSFVEELRGEWKEQSHLPAKEKLNFLDASQQEAIFSFSNAISTEIDKDAFQTSFLQQPDLFLRLRPGKEKAVLQKISAADINYSHEGACIRLSNSTKADDVIRLDEEAVVQDISSQRVLESLQHQTPKFNPQTVWDCCAASGGKTILFHDAYPKARLTVSDIRESIITNLKNRLKRAGVNGYKSFVADVSAPQFLLPQKFDMVICDAPCSGSGTWARTPEQLVFFKEDKIGYYATLQKKIALNASRSLKQGAHFLYITCSVFVNENEEVVSHLQEEGRLKLLSQQYFKGYDKKGDTLFAALFTTS